MYYYQRLRDLREDADKTQKEIAELLNTNQSQYQKYESGKREELASFWTRYERSIGVIIEGIDNKGRDYQNASRSIVRLVWFLDFVYEMVWYMRENPKVGIRSGNDM